MGEKTRHRECAPRITTEQAEKDGGNQLNRKGCEGVLEFSELGKKEPTHHFFGDRI